MNRRKFLKDAGYAGLAVAVTAVGLESWGYYNEQREQALRQSYSQLYPPQDLNVDTKGVVYWTNRSMTWFDKVLGFQTAKNDLDVIRDELGCNGIRIVTTLGSTAGAGGAEEDLLTCAEMAIAKGFDNVTICPRYMDASLDETEVSVKKFAVDAEKLSQKSDAIVFQVGNELSIDAWGICTSPTYAERCYEIDRNVDNPVYQEKLDDFLTRLVSVSRENYHGKLSYAAHPGEWAIPWDKLDFDIIGQNQYWWPQCTDEKFVDIFKRLKDFGKPVHITEFGCMTYDGAFQYGGDWQRPAGTYDEDAQAEGIKHYLDLISEARVYGCFLWAFRENAGAGSCSLVDGDHRKKSFNMYKAYRKST